MYNIGIKEASLMLGVTVFSARLYGSRSHKNKQIIEQLKEVAKDLK
jgi:predicted site-specific integrase-resolvase